MADIRITWEPPIDKSIVDSISIYRYVGETSDCNLILSDGVLVVEDLATDSTNYDDLGIINSNYYSYGVFSKNVTGFSPCAHASLSLVPTIDGSPTDLTAVYVAAAPVEGPTNIVPTIEVAPKYGIDTGIFVYPLFITEAESNYYDSQFGGTGTSHTMTYNSVTYYMPANGATHAGTEAPTFVTINGNDFNYTQIVTGFENGHKPTTGESPTALTLKVDMDGDGFYADVDVDDNDDSVNIAPDANGAPTGLTSTEQTVAPSSGPTDLGTTTNPNEAPSGLGTTTSPNEAPSGLTSVEEILAPTDGPTYLTSTEEQPPTDGPTYLTSTEEPPPSQGDILTNTLATDVDLEMLYVEPGTFTMGSPYTEAGRGNGEIPHDVTLTKGFYLGKYEVTQAQYEAVMTGNTDGLSATPSNWPNNPNRPVEKASWNDAQIFLSRLNAQQSANIPDGWSYVLPTEAQWEYACRAGTTTAYSWGDTISPSDANYNWDGEINTGNDFNQTRDVGQYAANPWGFYDMHGNVWEWCADFNGDYSSEAQTDPTGAASSPYRILRGASWTIDGPNLRSARRYYWSPSSSNNSWGFRVALTPPLTAPADGPTDLGTTTNPNEAPSGLETAASPSESPTGLTSVELAPTNGPTDLTSILTPTNGPTDLTSVEELLAPTDGPTGLITTVAPGSQADFSDLLYPVGGSTTNGFYSMYTGQGILEITATTATWDGPQGSGIVIWSQSNGDSLATTSNFLTGWDIQFGNYSSGAYQDITVSYTDPSVGGPTILTHTVIPYTPITFADISAATFFIGAPSDNAALKAQYQYYPPAANLGGVRVDDTYGTADENYREVTLTKDYKMATTCVTRAQYLEVMSGYAGHIGLYDTVAYGNNPPSADPDNFNLPVHYVSWLDAQEFVNRLNAQEPVVGWEYVLPTEAQWEYACKAVNKNQIDAGTHWYTKYWLGDTITTADANYGSYSNTLAEVQQYNPNAFGIYDLIGGVKEWTSDIYASNYVDSISTDYTPLTDPAGGASLKFYDNMTQKGGLYKHLASEVRSASRDYQGKDMKFNGFGFRVAMVPSP